MTRPDRKLARARAPALRLALVLSALASGAALLVAFGSEWWGGLVPCALCLIERWPYRIALALSLIGLVLPRALARGVAALVVLAALGAAGTGALHVGVENGLWPSPLPQCEAPRYMGGGSIADRLAHMPARPSKSCEDPTYLIPAVPVSMAAMNLIYGLAFAIILGTFLWRTRRTER